MFSPIKTFLAVAATVAIPAGVLAQVPGVVEQPTGFRMGAGRLTTSFELESRYDSMAGYVADDTVDGGLREAGDMILLLKPGLHFKVPSDSLEIALKANYEYQGYMGAEESTLTEQSKSAMNLAGGLLFNRDGNVRAELTDTFVRSDRTSNLALGAASISNRNDAALRVSVLEKGAWSVTPSYTLTTENFESLSGLSAHDSVVEQYDYLAHNGGLDVRYGVFGESALLLDVGVGHRTYTADKPVGEDVGHARAMIGLGGKVSPKLGYTLKAGYGTQFGLEEADGFGSAVGSAELAWFATELSEVRLGYARGFEADPTFAFYGNNRVYANAGAQMTQALKVRGGVSYDMISFGADGSREDTLVGFNVSPEYAFNRWFSAGVHYGFTTRDSEGNDETVVPAYLAFDRHEFGARAMVVY
ncbi:hypothetical protein [Vulgatibacter sp.]|uniref:hypothetical protein n=1 Tax=Vulgatibacter sp. TaxID=1971226 RepID=UPI0035659D0B